MGRDLPRPGLERARDRGPGTASGDPGTLPIRASPELRRRGAGGDRHPADPHGVAHRAAVQPRQCRPAGRCASAARSRPWRAWAKAPRRWPDVRASGRRGPRRSHDGAGRPGRRRRRARRPRRRDPRRAAWPLRRRLRRAPAAARQGLRRGNHAARCRGAAQARHPASVERGRAIPRHPVRRWRDPRSGPLSDRRGPRAPAYDCWSSCSPSAPERSAPSCATAAGSRAGRSPRAASAWTATRARSRRACWWERTGCAAGCAAWRAWNPRPVAADSESVVTFVWRVLPIASRCTGPTASRPT